MGLLVLATSSPPIWEEACIPDVGYCNHGKLILTLQCLLRPSLLTILGYHDLGPVHTYERSMDRRKVAPRLFWSSY